MRVIIENWGPIKRFEYDLTKSIIITYGENNIGKSYAMQVLYLLLKKLIQYSEAAFMPFRPTYYTEPLTGIMVDFSKHKEMDSQDITKALTAIHTDYMTELFMSDFLDACRNTFGTFSAILEDDPRITLLLGEHDQYIFAAAKQQIYSTLAVKKVRIKKVSSDFHKSREYKTSLDIYIYENHVKEAIQKAEDFLIQMNQTFAKTILGLVEDVYFLPASRSGIYSAISSFGPILAELSKSRAYTNRAFHIPSLSEPISDYFMALSNIKGEPAGRYKEFAVQIEQLILKGEVLFDPDHRSITYLPYDDTLKLEMADTSSMVSEISPITAFFKYIIQEKDRHFSGSKDGNPKSIIFIEEPEAHLHPANQVALMELFAELSRQNIQLIMASHSNYIFNKLNNMVLSKKLNGECYGPILLKKENGRSYSHSLVCDELGVTDENFADIAYKLYEEREEIIQQMISDEQEE